MPGCNVATKMGEDENFMLRDMSGDGEPPMTRRSHIRGSLQVLTIALLFGIDPFRLSHVEHAQESLCQPTIVTLNKEYGNGPTRAIERNRENRRCAIKFFRVQGVACVEFQLPVAFCHLMQSCVSEPMDSMRKRHLTSSNILHQYQYFSSFRT